MSGIGNAFKSVSVFGGAPKYNQGQSISAQKQAAELQSKYGLYDVESPLGSVKTVQNDGGTFSRVYESSDADKLRNQLIGQGLSGINLNPTQAQNAYYQQATRELLPQFERQQERLDTNLINRGIGVGTEQYNQAIEDLRNQQAGTLSDISNQAVFQGQNLLGSQIANIGALTGQRDIGALPGLASSTGASFQETYSPSYQSDLTRYQDRQQKIAQLAQLGAMASDRRLKENLTPVGFLDNGLVVYLGNYKEETGFDTRPQLFLIAQEVEELNPDAVIEQDDGYLAVNYEEAVK